MIASGGIILEQREHPAVHRKFFLLRGISFGHAVIVRLGGLQVEQGGTAEANTLHHPGDQMPGIAGTALQGKAIGIAQGHPAQGGFPAGFHHIIQGIDHRNLQG